MEDYHVFSMDDVDSPVKDHGVALHVDDVKWAKNKCGHQMQTRRMENIIYFSNKDYKGIFRIGVAIGENPQGPFMPMDKPIEGSFSIDPAVYKDENGEYYMYFGGLGVANYKVENWGF